MGAQVDKQTDCAVWPVNFGHVVQTSLLFPVFPIKFINPKFTSLLKAPMHSLTAGIPFETNSTALIAT